MENNSYIYYLKACLYSSESLLNPSEITFQTFCIAGFIIDLLDKISAMLDFDYTIHEVESGKYGHRTSSGRWSGVIGRVKRQVLTKL